MIRRDFLKRAALGVGALAAGFPMVGKAVDAGKRLNVMVVMTDQHHAAWLGCAGHPVVKTPHLDKLAREGALREPRQLYQHQLAALGYHCYQLGKWHLGNTDDLKCLAGSSAAEQRAHVRYNQQRRAKGADAFDPGPRDGEAELIGDVWLRTDLAEAHRKWKQEPNTPKQDVGVIGRCRLKPELAIESVLAESCIELLRQHRDEPFAITYSVSPPHAPWIAPAPYYDQYDPRQMPLPATWTQPPPEWTKTHSARMGKIYGESGAREYLRCYAAQITMMDACFGRILVALDELKLTERTLVIFTSDHGNLLGQHGMMDKGVPAFYDDLMRVPLLARLPGVLPQDKTCGAFAATVDLAPTILDLLGAPPLAKMHGHSLRDTIAGKDAGPEAVFGERGDLSKPGVGRMIRTRRWKFNLQAGGVRELFDMENDPQETKNVAGDPANADIGRQLEARLRQHMASIGDPAVKYLKKENKS
ncbi:MAG: sulfatase-like hydrolase/transferase [Kiritimatiellaeota bacterium]|nr:sulfatase-like hydrolase/transferase [Kiritimatiellota bacterium]